MTTRTQFREGVELIEDQEDGSSRTFTFSGVSILGLVRKGMISTQVNIFWLGSSVDNPDVPEGPTPR